MAKITVRIKQLATAAALQNVDVLPARALGWAKDIRSICITQDDGSDGSDGCFRIPSTVGDGMGRRISKTAHGLSLLDPVRLNIDNGVASWGIASATATGNYNADFVVVHIIDANTFDVARTGSWSVSGVESLIGTVYLSANAKLTTTKPTGVVVQIVGKGDGTSLHLLLGSDAETSIDDLVDELNARDDLVAVPKGSAGGDLDKTYANPVVKQLSGVGAALVNVDTDISYTPETRESDPPTGGRGVCPGRHFRTINGVATDERCWCASDEYGEAFWSHDYFKSTVKDTSIRTGGPAASGAACYRWGTRRFVYIAGSINSYVWITGCGRSSGEGSSGMPGVFYAKHEAASYAADGSMLESAWHYLAWSTVGGSSGINGLNKAAAHDGVLVWIGDSRYIARTTTFADDAFVADGGSSDYRFSGVATDSYGNWGALGQWGDLWRSVPVGGAEGTAFTKLESVNVSLDGGKTYTSAAKLPGGDMGGLRWSSLLCCYGLWLAIVYVPGTSGYAYAYSEDFENWVIYSGSALTRFYDASTDGVRWFATNLYPSSAGANAVPPIYQLLVDSINVKRRLNLEKGMAVSGPVYMLDLPNAKMIGTDENGREVDASQLLALDDLKDVDTSTAAPTNGQVLEFNGTLWVPATVPSGAPLASTVPLIESGSGAVGTSTAAARADHVHPAASSTAYAKYAPTMDPVLATSQVAVPNGTTDQWAMTGSMLIPPADMLLTASASTMSMICPQSVSGGHYLYALYVYNADKSLSLVLSTGINTMPASSSWLEATITRLLSQPVGGVKYYFVLFNDCNGSQFEGISAATNLNIYPLPGIQKDASFHNFTEAPETIAFGGYTENTTRFFGRLKA